MKQLELNITIINTGTEWEIYAKPKNETGNKLVSWFKGSTKERAFKSFFEGICETYSRYWFTLEDT